MDFEKYFKANESKPQYSLPERKCLECGRVLEKRDDHLYRQSFCCIKCKEKYVGKKLDGF